MKSALLALLIHSLFFVGLFAQQSLQPPVAKVKPTTVTLHGDTRTDNYAWMKKKNSGAMQKYLKAENNYTVQMMADTKGVQDSLYKELLGRIKQTDMSVPYDYKGYQYYTRTVEGKNHGISCRKKIPDGSEEVLLDANQVIEEEKCYGAYMNGVSLNSKTMSYAIDKTGNFNVTVHFRDIESGAKLGDVLKDVTSDAWSVDNKTLFYTVQEKATNRSYRLYRHTMGTPQSADVLIYEEKDKRYDISVYTSRSEEFIYMACNSSDESEISYMPANAPMQPFKVLYPRAEKHEYSVSDYKGKFYIVTNKDAMNFKAVYVDVANPAMENWKELIPHRENVQLDWIQVFRDYLVISERDNGNDKVRIRTWETGEEYEVPFSEPAYALNAGGNPDFNTEWFRFYFSSLKTPLSAYEMNFKTKEQKLLKRWEIPSGHNPEDYVTEKVWATAGDGVKVPVSLLYKKGLKMDGSNPVYLEGYGAYGYGITPGFSNSIYPLVDRGYIYALAHVRGGDDLGRKWYYDGKMLNKRNTFTDFIACAEHLVEEKYTSAGMIVADGASAGGLLMGAVMNMRPDLFKAIILEVPFVDALNTMLDTLLPLTTQEFTEWGNPYEKEYYDYIKSYAPYENVRAVNYPNLLFISGLTDEQVGVWEPAKTVAKLRATKTDKNMLLFKVELKGGHGGRSGRYPYYEDLAFKYAWILKVFG